MSTSRTSTGAAGSSPRPWQGRARSTSCVLPSIFPSPIPSPPLSISPHSLPPPLPQMEAGSDVRARPAHEQWWGEGGADMFVATTETFLLVCALLAHMLLANEISEAYPWRIAHLALVRSSSSFSLSSPPSRQALSLIPLTVLYLACRGLHFPGRNELGIALFFLRIIVVLLVVISSFSFAPEP